MRPVIGLVSSFFAVAFTLTDFEQYLRIAGSCIGLAIGITSFVTMLIRLRRRKDDRPSC